MLTTSRSKHVDRGRRRINLWLNLVSTLVEDLGLDRHSGSAVNISCFRHQKPLPQSYDQEHTKEELRALLAGFIANSSLVPLLTPYLYIILIPRLVSLLSSN